MGLVDALESSGMQHVEASSTMQKDAQEAITALVKKIGTKTEITMQLLNLDDDEYEHLLSVES